MNGNLDRLNEAAAALDDADVLRLRSYLLGWLADVTPEPVWNAALERAVESLESRPGPRMTAV